MIVLNAYPSRHATILNTFILLAVNIFAQQ